MTEFKKLTDDEWVNWIHLYLSYWGSISRKKEDTTKLLNELKGLSHESKKLLKESIHAIMADHMIENLTQDEIDLGYINEDGDELLT
jgi:arsenate reductase-like glutaredoxin family protein